MKKRLQCASCASSVNKLDHDEINMVFGEEAKFLSVSDGSVICVNCVNRAIAFDEDMKNNSGS